MTGCAKRRIRLSCCICIFLCAALSVSAQSREEWLLRAVEQERAAFRAVSAAESNAALLARARCLKQAGDYADAAATLTRLAMYALTPEELQEVLYEKELCSYLAGDFAAAASFVDEFDARFEPWEAKRKLDALVLAMSGRAGELRLKKEGTAMALAFLPPLGHWYTGHYGEGLLSMGLNALAAGIGGVNIWWHNYLTALLAGSVALDYTFMGNQNRAVFLVEKYNYDARRDLRDKLVLELYQKNQ